MPAEQFAALLERGLLETVAAEDLERRIAALQRELAERDLRTEKVELENARLGLAPLHVLSPEGSQL